MDKKVDLPLNSYSATHSNQNAVFKLMEGAGVGGDTTFYYKDF